MKKSELVTCNICGKEVFARGLKSHVRLQHKSNTTVQINDEENIDYDVEETYEELQKIKYFYANVNHDEKLILKFVTWINEKNGKLDLPNILKQFCIFLINGGKTESEL